MSKKSILTLLFIFAVLSAGFLYFSLFQKTKIQAAVAGVDELSGWAWSSNIGWVSFNCSDQNVCNGSDYKVKVDLATGNLSGYAWSSNIGWIDFGPSGPYPSAGPNYSAKIDLSIVTGVTSGWIKAAQSDGWIKITDANMNSEWTKLTGWAWGDLVVGWLNFYDVKVPNLIRCDFSANPSVIDFAASSTLSWSCNPAAKSCSIDNNIGSASLPSGSVILRPVKTTNYTLTCQGSNPVVTKTYTAKITVNPPTVAPETSTSTPYQFQYREVIPRDN